jgi:hypothetical protein
VGPLLARHGTSSGCGWREVLRVRRVAAKYKIPEFCYLFNNFTVYRVLTFSTVSIHGFSDGDRFSFYIHLKFCSVGVSQLSDSKTIICRDIVLFLC